MLGGRKTSTSQDLATVTADLLQTKAWQKANPNTYAGLLKRLNLIKDSGLRPVRVLPASKLAELRERFFALNSTAFHQLKLPQDEGLCSSYVQAHHGYVGPYLAGI